VLTEGGRGRQVTTRAEVGQRAMGVGQPGNIHVTGQHVDASRDLKQSVLGYRGQFSRGQMRMPTSDFDEPHARSPRRPEPSRTTSHTRTPRVLPKQHTYGRTSRPIRGTSLACAYARRFRTSR
jgi:hypothetical protein